MSRVDYPSEQWQKTRGYKKKEKKKEVKTRVQGNRRGKDDLYRGDLEGACRPHQKTGGLVSWLYSKDML